MDRQLAAELLVAAVFGAEFLVHRRQELPGYLYIFLGGGIVFAEGIQNPSGPQAFGQMALSRAERV